MRLTLLSLSLATLLVAGCGDNADLETAVAPEVRGVSIDGTGVSAKAQPDSPASAQPDSPASAQPDSPASAQPDSPASAQPDSPASAQPDSPASAQPDSPASAQPDSPASAQPDSPASAQPDSPASAQPDSPASAQPDSPASAQPDSPESAQPGPQIPAKAGPDIPSRAGPDIPAKAGPVIPAKAGPEIPKAGPTPEEIAKGLGDQSTSADDANTPVDPETGAKDDAALAAEAAAEALDVDPPIEIPKPVLEDGIWLTGFDFLANFDPGILAVAEDSSLAQHTPSLPEKEGAAPLQKGIPDEVFALDGKQVRIEGYMIPLKFDDGKVKSFFLSRYMMGCCFGVLPKANEVIEVEMVDEGTYYDAYMPFLVTGKMFVMPDGTDDEKYLKTIYVIKATKCEYAEEW